MIPFSHLFVVSLYTNGSPFPGVLDTDTSPNEFKLIFTVAPTPPSYTKTFLNFKSSFSVGGVVLPRKINTPLFIIGLYNELLL